MNVAASGRLPLLIEPVVGESFVSLCAGSRSFWVSSAAASFGRSSSGSRRFRGGGVWIALAAGELRQISSVSEAAVKALFIASAAGRSFDSARVSRPAGLFARTFVLGKPERPAHTCQP
jgi:hypothetical protein